MIQLRNTNNSVSNLEMHPYTIIVVNGVRFPETF